MNITCPHCGFSKAIEPSRVPSRPVKVNCPKCSKGFTFDSSQASASESEAHATAQEQVSCPACGLMQPKTEQCDGCGVIFHKFRARQEETGQQTQRADTLNENLAELRRSATTPTADSQAKAGFWIRVVASMLDSFLLGGVQFVLSLMIGLVIGLLGLTAEGNPAINIVIWLFGASLSVGYVVFFIGYCGQTPGKMALRIKVIRTDGSPLTYGRAALREIPGKFISSILLGIGYLMVAFDSQKQGLHDKMADTYVVKL